MTETKESMAMQVDDHYENNEIDTGCFAVCEREVERLTTEGVNELIAYIVLAAGTGKDHSTTAWSAQAVEKYTGLRWRRAKHSINRLHEIGLITDKAGSTKKPRYKLKPPAECIWLPKTFVIGVSDEQPPLQRLRQMQDVETIYLALWIYATQNLAEDWGIHRHTLRNDFDSEHIRTWAQWRILGFKDRADPFCDLPAPWGDGDKNPWRHMRRLIDSGIIEWTIVLFEGPEGEPIHPASHTDFRIIDDALADFREGARFLIDNADEFDYVVPVPRHLPNVQMTQIGRTRYRAQTTLTRQWFSEHASSEARYAETYRTIAQQIRSMAA